jgi:hypothetical protein
MGGVGWEAQNNDIVVICILKELEVSMGIVAVNNQKDWGTVLAFVACLWLKDLLDPFKA